jgi:hypothetical protein
MEWKCGMNVDFDCEIVWTEPVIGNVSHEQDNIKMDLGK